MKEKMPNLYREPRSERFFPVPDLPIGLWQTERQHRTMLHDHDFINIAIITKGHGLHQFKGTVLPVGTGDVFVINRACAHAWVETHGLNISNVMVAGLGDIPLLVDLRQHPAFTALFVVEPKFHEQLKGRGRLKLDVNQLARLQEICNRLDRALHDKIGADNAVAVIQLLSLINFICDAYLEDPNKHHKTVLRISKSINYLEQNWQQDPDGKELAEVMSVSTPTFYRIFHQATGTNPTNYVNKLRVRKASELLLNTDNTISEIAFKVGFNDSNYFSRIFHKVLGVPPGTYRRNASK
jgi:AraC family L-rhamnose operon regulatory protein RhaS